MTDLTTADYTEYAHHLRVAGQTVTADVIDALVVGRGDAVIDVTENTPTATTVDPALDAVTWIEDNPGSLCPIASRQKREALATIRDALDDRISPAEALSLLEWAPDLQHPIWTPSANVLAILERLARIAERDDAPEQHR